VILVSWGEWFYHAPLNRRQPGGDAVGTTAPGISLDSGPLSGSIKSLWGLVSRPLYRFAGRLPYVEVSKTRPLGAPPGLARMPDPALAVGAFSIWGAGNLAFHNSADTPIYPRKIQEPRLKSVGKLLSFPTISSPGGVSTSRSCRKNPTEALRSRLRV